MIFRWLLIVEGMVRGRIIYFFSKWAFIGEMV